MQARASLAEGIRRTGGAVVLARPSTAGSLDAINRARADIAIVAPQPVWHGGALLRLRDEACCPVVLLAQGTSRRHLDEAVEGGVMACLIEPVRAVQLASTLDLAVSRFREMRGLRQALADRRVIEKAKGLLMAREGLTEDEAPSGVFVARPWTLNGPSRTRPAPCCTRRWWPPPCEGWPARPGAHD